MEGVKNWKGLKTRRGEESGDAATLSITTRTDRMKKENFYALLKKGILLFDGAMGTQLQAAGLEPGTLPESWNLSHPDAVRRIHGAYIDAGARVVTTNSFGGSRFKLDHYGLGEKVREINRQAALLAHEACSGRAFVAGSLGPTGEFLEPLGDVPPDRMKKAFAEQSEALLEGGADIIIVETMMALDEACLAVSAAAESDVPVIASMTFDAGRGCRTLMGVDIPTAVSGLLEAGADAVGSNCGNGIEGFIEIIGRMREITEAPLLAEPNAGLPRLENGKTVYSETPEMMASWLPALREAGATLIGGCCGTTPEHIRLFAAELK